MEDFKDFPGLNSMMYADDGEPGGDKMGDAGAFSSHDTYETYRIHIDQMEMLLSVECIASTVLKMVVLSSVVRTVMVRIISQFYLIVFYMGLFFFPVSRYRRPTESSRHCGHRQVL